MRRRNDGSTASTGPMDGEFQGVDVAGRSSEIPQVHTSRFRDGLIFEHWSVRQDLPAMHELGVIDTVATD